MRQGSQTDGEVEDKDAGLKVLDKEDEGSSQDPLEEESFAALSTSKRRSKDSRGLADLLGQTYASGQCRKFKWQKLVLPLIPAVEYLGLTVQNNECL